MMYELIFDKTFKKDLSKLDKETRNRILGKVFELEKSPELGKHLVGIDIWSLRVGNIEYSTK
jgi:mRNA-degrading endonuclease RelE of RelBE toxin-antitoxin system